MGRLFQNDLEEWAYIKLSFWFYDEEAFAQECCQRWVTDNKTGIVYSTPEVHKMIWLDADSEDDDLNVIPRGFAKTTARSKIKVLHGKLYQYRKNTLIISSEGLGEDIVGDIRRELETNPLIPLVFGPQVPRGGDGGASNRKWRQKHLQLANGTEIETVSKGGSLRGKRPDEIIVDDPQEDKDVKNPRIALEFWDWFWSTVYNMLMPGGKVTVLGTVLSDNCFVNMLEQVAISRGFRVNKYPAILLDLEEGEDPFKVPIERYLKEGRSLWPERWSMEALRARYKKIGAKAFWQEFMHKPMVTNGARVFDEDYVYKVLKPIKIKNGIQYYKKLVDVEELPNGTTKVTPLYDASMGIDTAFGKVSGDYTVIMVRAVDGSLLAQYRGHIAQDALCGIVDKLRKQLKGCVIVPESNVSHAFFNASRAFNWHSEIYKKRSFDSISKKETTQLGFHTNGATKPLILNELDQRFRLTLWEVSEEQRQEIDKYYFDEKGAANAIAPYHDDTIIADAMCVQGLNTGVTGPLLSVG